MIGPTSVVPNPLEKIQLGTGAYVQLALKVKNNNVQDIVQEITKKAIGCRSLFDEENYVYTDKPCMTYQIPDTFPNLEEASKYVAKNNTIAESERLACVCYNKDTVIFNSSQVTADGSYMKMLLDHLCGRQTPKDPQSKLHVSMGDALFDRFSKHTNPINTMTTPIRNYRKPQEKEYGIYNLIEIPLKEKPHGLTDRLMVSATLSAAAYNKFLSNVACQVTVDARRYLENPDWRHCNFFSLLVADAHTNMATKYAKMSIAELEQSLRKDLKEKLAKDEPLSTIGHIFRGTYPRPMTGIVNVCNLGIYKTGGDITDAMVTTSISKGPFPPGGLSISASTVNDVLRARVYTSPYLTSFKEAEKFKKAVEYCIKELKAEMNVREAFNNITKLIHQ